MKQIVSAIAISLLVNNANSQVTFSNVDTKLKTVKNNEMTDLICSNPTFSVKFQLKQKTVRLQENFAYIDSQLIIITPLVIEGDKKDPGVPDTLQQKQLLKGYSQYEMDYFKNDLHTEVINPNSQWVISKSKGWHIWYFRVGKLPTETIKPVEVQLFASTIVGNKIVTINAPVFQGGNFSKAALIVNEMMESMK